MLTELQIKKIISKQIEQSITNYFSKKRETTFHVLDYIFPYERKVRSMIGGLETSLGTQLWEKIATEISRENNFSILNHKEFNKSVPILPNSILGKISDFKEKKRRNPNIKNTLFLEELTTFIKNNNITSKNEQINKGTGIDLWIKKDNTEYIFDIKTNQINAGGGNTLLSNQLHWYAHRSLMENHCNIKCYIAFPFNPYSEIDFWKKTGNRISPLIPTEEAIVGDEFWDLLSGSKNTTKIIFDTFKELGESGFGNKFMERFKK
ncbi:TdeIII family type II restriction endonuclease [Proteus terrae]|uniref:TdeIII family type II restriction endonuclease n=1 Tax=Proteus terrae TaxID=1574161 RepID=UPI00370A411C